MIWERVETSQGQCMTGSAKLCGPINSMGHTAHVVANRMIVIFGHSPKYGYLDTVQEYHFFNKVSHFFDKYSAANFCFNKGLCMIWNRDILSQHNTH